MSLVIALLAAAALAADMKGRFYELVEKKDLNGAEQVLQEWEAGSPKDVELLICYANLYLRKAREGEVRIETRPAEEGKAESADTGKTSTRHYYDPDMTKKAADYLESALEIAPNRLDVHYGVLYVHRETGNDGGLLSAMERTLKYTSQHSKELIWKDGKPLDRDPSLGVPSAIQDHAVYYFSQKTRSGMERALAIATLLDRYYPDNVEVLNSIGAMHSTAQQWKEAIPHFRRAHRLKPEDSRILMNLGICFSRLGDRKAAVAHYRRIVELNNDPKLVKHAEARIAELEK